MLKECDTGLACPTKLETFGKTEGQIIGTVIVRVNMPIL